MSKLHFKRGCDMFESDKGKRYSLVGWQKFKSL